MPTNKSNPTVAAIVTLVGVAALIGCKDINDPAPKPGPSPAPSFTAHAYASPPNGEPPLTVTLRAWSSGGGAIVLYEWDFDGDGEYEWRSTGTREITRVFEERGLHSPRLRITDQNGATATAQAHLCVSEQSLALICE